MPDPVDSASRRGVMRSLCGAAGALLLPACGSLRDGTVRNGPTQRPAAIAALCSSTGKPGVFEQTTAGGCLMPGPASAQITRGQSQATAVWAYNGSVPGPVLRVKQGSRAGFELLNRLPDATTIHWHGLRVANAMDGVPGLTQQAVPSGERFNYELHFPDSGTYWYHPHLGTPEQLGRGLSGALIVQEKEPPAVDAELVWLLDDWRLERDGQIKEDFYSSFDVSHAGRIGNTVTINGQIPTEEAVTPGQRIRLRLINAANARIFALQFEGHQPWVIAMDGHALDAAKQLDPKQLLFIGPGSRADLIVDMNGQAGMQYKIIDRFNKRRAYEVTRWRYTNGTVNTVNAGNAARTAPALAPASTLAQPVLAQSRAVTLRLGGGMMNPNRAGRPRDSVADQTARRMRRLAGSREADPFWTINGQAHMQHGDGHPVEFEAQLGETIQLTFQNQTNWWHPMHLHGHVYREVSRDGKPVPGMPWRDTSLIAPRQNLTVAFVADNPGNWLIHCHILEHHAGGMGTQFRVLG